MSDTSNDPEAGGRLSSRTALQGSAMAEWLTPTSQSRVERIVCTEVDERAWPADSGDDDALIALRRSVSQRGVIEPLLLRPGTTGRLEVVLGARRLRVARDLGLANVPAIVRELSESEAALLAAWSILPRIVDHGMSEVAAHLSAAGVADGEIALLLAASRPDAVTVNRSEHPRTFASAGPLRFATLATPVSRLLDALGPARAMALAALNRADTHRLDLVAS